MIYNFLGKGSIMMQQGIFHSISSQNLIMAKIVLNKPLSLNSTCLLLWTHQSFQTLQSRGIQRYEHPLSLVQLWQKLPVAVHQQFCSQLRKPFMAKLKFTWSIPISHRRSCIIQKFEKGNYLWCNSTPCTQSFSLSPLDYENINPTIYSITRWKISQNVSIHLTSYSN